jgi:hypothetical protein
MPRLCLEEASRRLVSQAARRAATMTARPAARPGDSGPRQPRRVDRSATGPRRRDCTAGYGAGGRSGHAARYRGLASPAAPSATGRTVRDRLPRRPGQPRDRAGPAVPASPRHSARHQPPSLLIQSRQQQLPLRHHRSQHIPVPGHDPTRPRDTPETPVIPEHSHHKLNGTFIRAGELREKDISEIARKSARQ